MKITNNLVIKDDLWTWWKLCCCPKTQKDQIIFHVVIVSNILFFQAVPDQYLCGNSFSQKMYENILLLSKIYGFFAVSLKIHFEIL